MATTHSESGAGSEDPLTDDPLTSRVQIWQRRRGHRYSLDDVLTAFEAIDQRPSPARYLDLGCGIGSVLLMVCDRAHPGRAAAIEAQEISHALAERNIERNDFEVELAFGDFRKSEVQRSLSLSEFDLITGTPPYAPVGTATPSPDSQRAHARIEYRGGIEAYMDAASALLAPEGDFVVCAAGDPERVLRAAEAAGLVAHRRVDAIPRAGRDTLFHVWRLRRPGAKVPTFEAHRFVARDEEGERTEAYVQLRRFFGLPKREATR